MPQPRPSLPPKPYFILQPPCPTCGHLETLTHASPIDGLHEVRTFKCKACGHTETIIVKL